MMNRIGWKSKGTQAIGGNPPITYEWVATLPDGWKCGCQMLIGSGLHIENEYLLLFSKDTEMFLLDEEELDKCYSREDLRRAKMKKYSGVRCTYTNINENVSRFLREHGIN